MKTKLLPTIVASLLLTISSSQAGLFEDFNGSSINSGIWNTMTTGSGSSISISGGNGVFRDRGRLTTIQSFSQADILGRLKFTESPSDSFKIILRTDGAIQNTQYQEAANGIMVEITSSANWDSDASRNVRIVNLLNGGVETIQSGLVLNMNTFYDFHIIDTGTSVSAYIGNLSQPLITLQTSASSGDKISFYNREQIGSINHTTQLDYINITTVPEPTAFATISVTSAFLLSSRILRRKRDF